MTTRNQTNAASNDNMREEMTGIAEREILITRIVDAPRELVFNAWTDPAQVAEWWGPKMFTNPVCELDVQPGGAIYIVMRSPDGKDYPMRGYFREIARPERLVYTYMAFLEGMDNPIFEGQNTITLVEVSELPAGKPRKTKLTLRLAVTKSTPEASDAMAGMEKGWKQSLDRLTCFVEIE